MEQGLIEFGESRKVENAVNKVFSYQGTSVTFIHKDGKVMVNATEMAKPFGDSKRAKNWLTLNATNEFLNILSKGRNLPLADLVRVTKGGNNPGTWMHEDVALEFARWLSPAFAIWCNDRIKELLTVGITATQPTLEAMLNNPDLVIGLATKLKQQREENERLALENKQQAVVIAEQKPKVVFADSITGCQTNILIRDLAKLICQNGYDIGEKRLYQWMRDKGYLCVTGRNYNKPMQRYVEQGLFFIKEGSHSEKGVLKANFTTMVTGKGQQYFVNIFLNGDNDLFGREIVLPNKEG